MKDQKVICAGFGGQGVMSLGQLLAYAGMIEGKQVTWMPSYGPEMRGGTAYCCVVISDQAVGSPIITDDATCAIVMNLPSLIKFEPRVVPGGYLLVNSSLVDQGPYRDDLQVYYIPAFKEADECGNGKMANMIMLGAYLFLSGVVQQASAIEAFKKVFGSKGEKMQALNEEALRRGALLVEGEAMTPAYA